MSTVGTLSIDVMNHLHNIVFLLNLTRQITAEHEFSLSFPYFRIFIFVFQAVIMLEVENNSINSILFHITLLYISSMKQCEGTNGGSAFLRNGGIALPHNIASRLIRQKSPVFRHL
jgi:hypothetical protein